MVACEKKLKVIPPYKIAVVRTYILTFVTHWPPPPPEVGWMRGIWYLFLSLFLSWYTICSPYKGPTWEAQDNVLTLMVWDDSKPLDGGGQIPRPQGKFWRFDSRLWNLLSAWHKTCQVVNCLLCFDIGMSAFYLKNKIKCFSIGFHLRKTCNLQFRFRRLGFYWVLRRILWLYVQIRPSRSHEFHGG